MKIQTKLFSLTAAVVLLSLTSVQAAVTTGAAAPDFTLTDTFEKEHSLSDFKGKYVVLEWLNHDCPFVKKHYESKNMQSLQEKYTQQGVVWLSVNSSAHGKQGHYHSEEANQLTKQKGANPTAVLIDADGDVGRLYGAQTTPHIFIINPEGHLIYQGAIDSIASANLADIKQADNYVEQTLNAAMNGQPVLASATKSYGCSVKY
ncbi:MAG: thioredoxin family protein [Candidatus Omnitrophica bacterium CG11_big_fil_rev_8_21_14_0_20_43_6]|nr:MAG: thioredoxin family protein [Candidatus Omnitrophica bacterium CG11_big_fil_rev_8_21_14_0_20_43_6]